MAMELTGNVEGMLKLLGGGSDVEITQLLTEGIAIAIVKVDDDTITLYAPDGGGSDVEVTPALLSGTKIADIKVDGDTTALYAPAPTSVNVNQVLTEGTKIASIGVNGVTTDIYAPSGGSHNYSLNEQIIGTWVDGSPLYQRTFFKEQVDINNGLISTSDVDFKYVYGTFLRSVDNALIMLPFQATSYFCRLYAGYSVYGGILLETNMTGSAVVTAIYTKSTDS